MYKKQGKNVWNYAADNDVLDFWAISLIIALKKGESSLAIMK